ncbi:MAG TPA: CoA transferase, partial [Rhodopila sp.]|nr:CoA transferase [Rhodopila sp.]
QVVDAAMVDGALSLMTPIYAMAAAGRMPGGRGENQLDSGAHYYEVYECADGQFISIAPIEEKFYEEFLRRMEIDPQGMPAQRDRAGWAAWKQVLTERFRTRTRDEWCRILEGTDACFAPVLSMQEAHAHPHNQARQAFIEVGGHLQPAPAPRFGGTSLAQPRPPGAVSVQEALAAWGISGAEAAALARV